MIEHAIIGAGGFGREVKAAMGIPDIKFFVDDKYEDLNNNILGLSKFDPKKYIVVVAIGDPKDRFDIIQRLPKETKYFTFIDPSAIIMDENTQIGEGSIICAGNIITTNVKIGKHAHLNLQTTIGHDCEIGDYFTTAPGTKISGNCKIHDCVYIGTNASVKEKISIYSFTTIGMNAAVVKDITESGTYVGVPAKKINK
jgi:sugar O-acyltransferase (sialic acid O-acetyltransferase NeuD family)